MRDVAQRTAFLIDREGEVRGAWSYENERGAGLRRAAGRRPGLVASRCALYAVAAVVATEPAIVHVATAVHGRRRARARRGGAGRPPPVRLPALARRPPARARPRAVDRPVLVPARGRLAGERRLVAVRAARTGRSTGCSGSVLAWNLFTLLCLFARRRAGDALAARARALAARGRCGRARLRDRPLPCDAEPRPPARADVAPAAARALGASSARARPGPAVVVGDLARWRSPRSPCPARSTSRSGRSLSIVLYALCRSTATARVVVGTGVGAVAAVLAGVLIRQTVIARLDRLRAGGRSRR